MAKTKKSDLKPGFPIIYQPGVRETVATAMQKIIKEFERIYRLMNDNIDSNDSEFENIMKLLKELQDQLDKIIKGPTVVDEAKRTSGTLTLQRNSAHIGSFNGSVNTTVNIVVPTKTSDLTNDSNFATADDLKKLKEEIEKSVTTSIKNVDAATVNGIKFRLWGNMDSFVYMGIEGGSDTFGRTIRFTVGDYFGD